MARTLLLSERTLAAGLTVLGPVSLPVGTSYIGLVFTTPSWPAVSDGTMTITYLLNGVQVWETVIGHQQPSRPIDIGVGCSFPEPSVPGDRLTANLNLTVAFTSAVSVELR